MRVGQKLGVMIGSQTVCVVGVCAIGLWAIWGLRSALDETTDRLASVRAAHTAGSRLVLARSAASGNGRDAGAARSHIAAALAAARACVPAERAGARDAVAADAAELVALLESASGEEDPGRLSLRASQGLAAVIRFEESVQRDVRARRENAADATEEAALLMGASGGFFVLVSVGAGVVQRRSVVRPLRSLRAGMVRLARDGRAERLAMVGDAEFRDVAARFNRMADELRHAHETLERRVDERTSQLIRSERLARLGVLAAGFAHEISNPLAIIRGHAELALRHRDRAGAEQEMADALEVTLSEVERSSGVVERLQSLGRGGEREHARTPLGRVAATAVSLVGPIARRETCAVICSGGCADEPSALGDEGELVQVVVNLVLNGIAAAGPGGRVAVSCAIEDGMACLRVEDDGVGLDPDELTRVFDPFVSGNGGMGLGLSVCQAIAERHGASIAAVSGGPGRGSRFTLRLPAADREGAD